MTLKIMTIVGARPQFIKAAAVARAIGSCAGIEECLVHTGQHYDRNLSDVFFDELEIPPPQLHLGIGSAGHGRQTGRMLAGLEEAMLERRPDRVLVYGDTNSTLAGALAAAKLHIPIAHVEAGLRSFNRRMPEEINRVIADHLSDLAFAPTEQAVRNLAQEGISCDRVIRSGDVMYDAALHSASRADQRSGILQRLGLSKRGFIVATVHRAENTDDAARLRPIIEVLGEIARALPVVFPLHPRTRRRIGELGLAAPETITMIEPVGYLDMAAMVMSARLVVTDSGGLQKEAYFHRVPCVTLRAETEWVELVEMGWNRLLDPGGEQDIAGGLSEALAAPLPEATPNSPYGDGNAAKRIVEHLVTRGG